MKRIGKFFRSIVWVAVVAIVVMAGINLFHPMMNKYHAMAANGFGQSYAQQWQGQGPGQANERTVQVQPGKITVQERYGAQEHNRFNFDHRGEQMAHPVVINAQRHHDGFGFGKFIFGLLMLFIGWKLFKRRGFARFIGAVIIAIIVLPLLMSMIVPVILLYLAWRFFFKGRRCKKRFASTIDMNDNHEYNTTHTTTDYLDEWEKNIRQKFNNKEEK